MKITTKRDMSKPTNNVSTKYEPNESDDDLFIQPENPDDHYIDGEDECDWDRDGRQ